MSFQGGTGTVPAGLDGLKKNGFYVRKGLRVWSGITSA